MHILIIQCSVHCRESVHEMLWEQVDKENDCLTSSVKGSIKNVCFELSFIELSL